MTRCRNLQRFVQRDTFDNPQGGGGQFGPEIQFDTKGVEFGPWVRRFIAQVKRNWLPMIPYSAMMYKGHVVVTFNVHKDGSLTEVTVVGPCPVDAFNTAAFGALKASNPTEPLPREYPDRRGILHGHVLLQRSAAAVTRSQQRGLLVSSLSSPASRLR